MIMELVVLISLTLHPSEPPVSGGVKDLLSQREGFENKVYMDTTGHLTGGTGHKLSPEEIMLYPEGTDLPKELTDKWESNDRKTAKNHAETQSRELGIEDEDFNKALQSMNFQSGGAWNKDHKETWEALMNKDYDKAIWEIEHNSLWYKQTPKRAKDFIKAIEKLKQRK